MSDLDPARLREAVLLRLRLERELGLETAPRVARPASLPQPARQEGRSPAAATGEGRYQGVASTALGGEGSEPPAQATRAAQPTQSAQSTPAVVAKMQGEAAPIAGVKESEGADGLGQVPDLEKRWQELEQRVRVCKGCPLHAGRTQTVFGEGDRQAQVVFVGEGPGGDEDRLGRPFVGKAGQLLDKIIQSVGWQREQVYICNIVKCRPPENRTPLPDEAGSCLPYLEEQLELIRPRVIIALGKTAAQYLLKVNTGITALRGRWMRYKGIPVMPTFHPSYILRTYTTEVRGAVWSDMKQARALLDS